MHRWITMLALAIVSPAPTHAAEEIPTLDPTHSYGIIWEAVEPEEKELISEELDRLTDINTLVELEEEGLIVIGSIHEFAHDGETRLVYDSGFDTGVAPAGPRALGAVCPNNARRTYITDDSDKLEVTYSYVGWRQSYDIQYYPNCPRYPCWMYAKADSGWPGGRTVWTDFSWRSGFSNSYNYWTTQVYPGSWTVTLYSGDSTLIHHSPHTMHEQKSLPQNMRIFISFLSFLCASFGALLFFSILDLSIHDGREFQLFSRGGVYITGIMFIGALILYFPFSFLGYRAWKRQKWQWWGASLLLPVFFAYAGSFLFAAAQDLPLGSCGFYPLQTAMLRHQSQHTFELTDDFLLTERLYYSPLSGKRFTGIVGTGMEPRLGLNHCQAYERIQWKNVSSSTITLGDLPSNSLVTLSTGESYTETFRKPTIQPYTLNGVPKIIHIDAFDEKRQREVNLSSLEQFCKRFATREVKFIVDNVVLNDAELDAVLAQASLELVQKHPPYFVIAQLRENTQYESVESLLSSTAGVHELEPDCLLDESWKEIVRAK